MNFDKNGAILKAKTKEKVASILILKQTWIAGMVDNFRIV